MANKNKNKSQSNTGNDLLENPEALAEGFSKTEEFINNNKVLVFGIFGVIVLLIGGLFGFKGYKNNQNEQANNEMFQAIYYYDADSLELALNGDANNLGFLDIIDEYGITDAANLANFYAGSAYLKQGKYKLAILYLEDFKSSDLLVQARAYSLIGDASLELGDHAKAADYYQQAADYKPNKFFTPIYLMKAALAYEKSGDKSAAIKAYDTIIAEYWESTQYQNARKYRASLNGDS